MSYKTRELTKLFPEAYASDDAHSLLYRLLEVLGAELMVADEKIKQLLKSHWVNYASGRALDGLAAIYGVQRRFLPDGTLEPDAVFRLRLKGVVPLFTGGGTNKAVLGAVRSSLGLPFDLDQLNLPAGYAPLRRDLENLITLEEFSPTTERLVEDDITEVGGASELTLVVDIPSVKESRPRIRWTFPSGGEQPSGNGRWLSVALVGTQRIDEFAAQSEGVLHTTEPIAELIGVWRQADDPETTPALATKQPLDFGEDQRTITLADGVRPEGQLLIRYIPEKGVKSKDGLLVRSGESLILSARDNGNLSAAIGARDVSDLFTNLDGTEPATMPEVPLGRSEWRFRAHSGLFGGAQLEERISTFDDDTYDLPRFEVEMGWTRYEPLSFDVHVPYLFQKSVDQLREQHKYPGEIFAFKGLPQQRIQEVVDQTRAAGVRGHVHFSLNWVEDHGQRESARIEASHRVSENAGAEDYLTVGSLNREAETHDLGEVFVIGGVWDVSTVDGSYGFQ